MNDNSNIAAAQTSALELDAVSKSFGDHSVLDRLTLRIATGQLVCIYGPNAAGKTTLLRVAAGLLQASEGRIRVCGYDLADQPEQARARLGLIAHKPMVYPQLTVLENLRFAADLYGLANSKAHHKNGGQAHIERLLDQTGLASYRHDPAGILSRGITQRLAIAKALVHQPTLLLADEPFTGLDADAANRFTTIIQDLRTRGCTVVLTTHATHLPLQLCDRVVVIEQGSIVLDAPAGDIDPAQFSANYLTYARQYAR